LRKSSAPRNERKPEKIIAGLYYDFRRRRWQGKLPEHNAVVERWYCHTLGVAHNTLGIIALAKSGRITNPSHEIEDFFAFAQEIQPWAETLRDLIEVMPSGMPGLPLPVPKGWLPSVSNPRQA
jgi:hypothetical protein